VGASASLRRLRAVDDDLDIDHEHAGRAGMAQNCAEGEGDGRR